MYIATTLKRKYRLALSLGLITCGVLFCVRAASSSQERQASEQQQSKYQLRLKGSRRDQQVLIRVSVHAPGGSHYNKPVEVRLVRNRKTYPLRLSRGSLLYEATIPPGTYQVMATAGEWTSPSRTVWATAPTTTVSIYLGKKDWPFYRLGENIVPFEPREDLIAVVFEARKLDRRAALQKVQQLCQKLPLEPLRLDEQNEWSFMAADGAIWLFKLTKPGEADARKEITAEIRRQLGNDVRIGLPVDLIPGQVKVLDNRFVIRFRDHVKPAEIAALAKMTNATILRGFIQGGNARLLQFNTGGYRDHLRIVEQWTAQGLLVYGEPDLMAEITDDQFPCAASPNDPTFVNQANLTLQDVDDAWCYLSGISANLTLGSPNIYVATIDRGIDTDHPDLGGLLTDGTQQLAQCYDFSGLRACTVAG